MTQTSDPNPSHKPYPMSVIRDPYVIVLWGDRYTVDADEQNGWVSLLREHYCGKALFHNLGVDGAGSEAYCELVGHEDFIHLMPRRFDHIYIQLGHSDTDPARYRAMLNKLVSAAEEFFKAAKKTPSRITVILPTAVAERTTPITNLSPQNEIYKEARKVAVERNLPLLDLYTKLKQKPAEADNDGYTPASNKAMFELFAAQLGDLPMWRDEWTVWMK